MALRIHWAGTFAGALLLAFVTAGCAKEAEVEARPAPVALPKPPAVQDGPGPYVLRYFSAGAGELVAVKTPAEVPEAARGQVLVVPEDPSLHGPWIFVADLTKKVGQGYEVHTVDRAEVERAHAAAAPAPGAAQAGAGPSAGDPIGTSAAGGPAPGAMVPAPPTAAARDTEVIIYKTAWCGYCKKVAQYLNLKGVPYIEKDLERDPGARADMLARAQRAGVSAASLQGVPILAVKGRIINGFNREAIDRALAGG